MEFKDITTVNLQLQVSVLSWRNHIDIRKNMYTDSIITEQQHLLWLSSLQSNKSTYAYIAFQGNVPIGIVSINNINFLHKNADWAFYLNPEFLKKKGYGFLMEYHFLNFLFKNFDIEKLNCEVLAVNPSVIKLHKKFGFTEEGIRRQNIIKDNNRIDVHCLGILKHEWYQIQNKFIKIIERLEK